MQVWGGSPTFTNVPARSNRGLVGSGFYIGGNAVVTITSDSNLTNGTVLWNSSADSGGGFYVKNAAVALTGLRTWWNSAPNYGGSIYWENSTIMGTCSETSLFYNLDCKAMVAKIAYSSNENRHPIRVARISSMDF